jgi:dihydrodipicolinate synthase/N-acetylneuraminate lyase
VDELRRGAVGNMPACHATDALVAVWQAWQEGDEARAQRLHNHLLPLLSYERCYGGTPIYKQVLYRRGVIESPTIRTPAPELDAVALRELDRIMVEVGDLFRQ